MTHEIVRNSGISQWSRISWGIHETVRSLMSSGQWKKHLFQVGFDDAYRGNVLSNINIYILTYLIYLWVFFTKAVPASSSSNPISLETPKVCFLETQWLSSIISGGWQRGIGKAENPLPIPAQTHSLFPSHVCLASYNSHIISFSSSLPPLPSLPCVSWSKLVFQYILYFYPTCDTN